MNNHHSILTPITLGVTRATGGDFNVQIIHIMAEDEKGTLGTTGIFSLYRSTFGQSSVLDDLHDKNQELYDLLDNDNPYYLGKILFDDDGHWIYDGNKLSVDEQEQIGGFISSYDEGDVY